MKKRIAASALVLLFFSFLIYASHQTEIDVVDPSFFQLDSKLIYVIVSAFALGALVLFLLVSIFPLRNAKSLQRLIPSSSRQLPAEVLEVEAAIQLKDYEQAEELLSEFPPEHPDYWYAQKLKGDLELVKDDPGSAERYYQESLKISAGNQKALVYLALANLWEQQDKFDRAKDLYREILQIDECALEAIFRLRSFAMQEEDWREALLWQERLEQIAWKMLATPEETAVKLGIRYELAFAEYEAGNYPTAQALLKFILRMTDSFTPAYLLSGEIHNKFENPSAALKMWERGLENTQNPILLQRIGEFYLSRNLPEKAIEFFRNFLLQHPEDPLFEFCLVDLYRKLEMTEEAGKLAQKMDESYPGWVLNQAVLASLYERSGRGTEAAQILRRVLESTEADGILPWQCYICNTTYPAYRSFCLQCLDWNSISLNRNKAGITDLRYVESTASPP